MGIDNKFWTLLMMMEVVEMSKVRGRVKVWPLYWAEVRLKRVELRLNINEL